MRCVLRLVSILLIGWTFLPGCAAPPPTIDPSADAASLLASADPIFVEVHQLPLDAPAQNASLLTLADAIHRALWSDPKIQLALANVRAAQAEAQQTRLLPNPIVNLAVRFQDNGEPAIIEAGLAADFLSLLHQPRRASAADKRLRASGAQVLVAVLDALADVQEAYALAQAIDEEISILQERRKLLLRLLDLAEARLKAGEGTRFDVTTVQSQISEIDVEIEGKELERAEQRLALARLIGRPSGEHEWGLSFWTAPPSLEGDEARWVGAALSHRPEIAAKTWELAALGEEIAIAQWGWVDGGEAGVHAERDVNWSVGPAIASPIPVFDWGQAKASKATAEQTAARHELVDTQRKIIEEVRRSHAAYRSSIATLKRATEELLPLQERRFEQAQSAYRAGETDLTSLLTAEQSLDEAREKLTELRKKATVSRLKLQRAAGGPAVAAGIGSATRPTTAP